MLLGGESMTKALKGLLFGVQDGEEFARLQPVGDGFRTRSIHISRRRNMDVFSSLQERFSDNLVIFPDPKALIVAKTPSIQ